MENNDLKRFFRKDAKGNTADSFVRCDATGEIPGTHVYRHTLDVNNGTFCAVLYTAGATAIANLAAAVTANADQPIPCNGIVADGTELYTGFNMVKDGTAYKIVGKTITGTTTGTKTKTIAAADVTITDTVKKVI